MTDLVQGPTAAVSLPRECGHVDGRICDGVLKAVMDAFKLAAGAGVKPARLTVTTAHLDDGSTMVTCQVLHRPEPANAV